MSHYHVFITLVLLTTVAMPHPTSVRNNVIRGKPGPNDKVLKEEDVVVPGSIIHGVTDTHNYSFSDDMITAIEVLDNRGNGATAKLSSSLHSATIKFENKRGHGIDFSVRIYGKAIPEDGSEATTIANR